VPQVSGQENEQLRGRAVRRSLGLELEVQAVGGELQLPDAAAALGAPAESDPRGCERGARHVEVRRPGFLRLELRVAERRQAEARRCPHTATIGLLDELGQLPPRLPGLLLEAGRVGARGLEQKLLPTLGVDLAQQVLDLPPARAHAASWSSTTSTGSATVSRAGRRKTATTTKAATSIPPRTTNDVWKPLTVADALATETPCVCA